MTARVRPYREGDLPALYEVCLKTGDGGADASHLYQDHKIIGEIYAAPYAALHPDCVFVAEDADGVAGYILGTPDTRAYEARLETDWWPPLRARYADTADVPLSRRTRAQWDAYYIHHPPANPQACVDAAPAHLHIDLLPRLQGQGIGKALMDTWLARIGGRAHLGCQAETTAPSGSTTATASAASRACRRKAWSGWRSASLASRSGPGRSSGCSPRP